ncbi:MAG TPA: hypothetical protein VH643_35370 [Gemmataceae bacterium]|jgi:hypothetical protein
MKTHKFSRRGLLGGLVAALTAWLCPRPPRAATPRRLAPTFAFPPSQFIHVTTYTYDGKGRLVRVTEHPPRPTESIRCTHVTHEHGVTHTDYYYG